MLHLISFLLCSGCDDWPWLLTLSQSPNGWLGAPVRNFPNSVIWSRKTPLNLSYSSWWHPRYRAWKKETLLPVFLSSYCQVPPCCCYGVPLSGLEQASRFIRERRSAASQECTRPSVPGWDFWDTQFVNGRATRFLACLSWDSHC